MLPHSSKRASCAIYCDLYLTKGLRSPKYDRYVSSLYIYRKSFLQPTSITGVSGQNLRISGNHIALQLRKDIGLAIEKHSKTTSDLKIKMPLLLLKYPKRMFVIISITCHKQIFCLYHGHRMCPTTEATH